MTTSDKGKGPNVHKLYPRNAAEKPDNVLEQAVGSYESVIVIGFNHDEFFEMRSSTNLDAQSILWLLESAKRCLFEAVEGQTQVVHDSDPS